MENNPEKRTPEQRQSDHHKVMSYFEHLSSQKRQDSLAYYTRLIDIEEGRLVSKALPNGKIFYYTKMPWMLPFWKEGLRLLKEIIIAKGEITDET